MKYVCILDNGRVIDRRLCSESSAKVVAKQLREQYKRMGLEYKVTIRRA